MSSSIFSGFGVLKCPTNFFTHRSLLSFRTFFHPDPAISQTLVGSVQFLKGPIAEPFILLGILGHPVFLWIAYFCMTVLFTWIMVYFAEVFRTEIRTTGMGIASLGTRISYVFGPLIAAALFPLGWGMFWIIPGLMLIIPLFILFLKPLETKGKTLEEIQEER